MIELRVLGPVHLLVDGGPAPPELLWRKNLALLAFLALAERPVRREQLVEMLWPDRPEAPARHSLNEALRQVRRVAGTSGVETIQDRISLAPGTVSLDLTRFTEAERAGRWAEAAAVVVGPFLEGFSVPDASGFEDWLAAERLRWTQRSTLVLTRHAEELYRDGRLEEALEVGKRAMQIAPHAEGALAIAVRVLALMGDRPGAIRLYSGHVESMREALGIPPGRGLVALIERVRADRLAGPAVRPSSQGTLAPPLVGRAAPLRRLASLAARVGERQAIGIGLVLGDMGSGRTRLLDEAAGRMRLEGWSVIHASSVPGDRIGAWGVLLALARQAIALPGVAGARAEAVRTFVERLDNWANEFPGLPAGPSLDLEPALRDVLAATLAEGPVAVALDDAHWMDPESLRAISLWTRELADQPLLVLLAANTAEIPEELDYLRSRLGRDLDGEVITLGPLAPVEIEALVRAQVPAWGPLEVERLVRRVATDSAGIPLLVTLLLEAVSDGLEPEGTAWPSELQTLDQSLPGDLPDGVVAALRVRYRRLDLDAQTLLTVLGVVDGRVTESELATLADQPLDRVRVVLDLLERSHWVHGDSRGYAIAGRLVRDVLARDMVTPGQRRRLLARRGSPPT